jgi:hypothetical protein
MKLAAKRSVSQKTTTPPKVMPKIMPALKAASNAAPKAVSNATPKAMPKMMPKATPKVAMPKTTPKVAAKSTERKSTVARTKTRTSANSSANSSAKANANRKINSKKTDDKATHTNHHEAFNYDQMLYTTMKDILGGSGHKMQDFMRGKGMEEGFASCLQGGCVDQKTKASFQQAIAQIMQGTKQWAEESARNASGLTKNTMGTYDSHKKLECIKEYAHAQVSANFNMLDAKLNAVQHLLHAAGNIWHIPHN